MNNIIFLDIDGVLNTTGDINLIENTFEESKLLNLVKLVNNTDSNLVIISDRRLIIEERMMIDNVFDEFKISVNYLSFNRTHKNRSDEIIEYLNENPCNHYVILDDNDLGYSESEVLKSHFLDTYKRGFTLDLYFKAFKILNLKLLYMVKSRDEVKTVWDFKKAKETLINELENIKKNTIHRIDELITQAYDLTEDIFINKYSDKFGFILSIHNTNNDYYSSISLEPIIGGNDESF